MAQRLCRYAEVWTTSDPFATVFPSTERQRDLSQILVDELRGLGLDAQIDEWGYVYATIPSTLPPDRAADSPVVALVAHVDTSCDAPGENVRPHITQGYAGGTVGLPWGALDPDLQPALAAHVGHDIITSDGSTLLGSDDKAGLALAMQLAADLVRSDEAARQQGERPSPRPTVRLLFTPDEEVGRGTEHVDLDRLGADIAYTLDGSGRDVLNVETFCAADATVTFDGVIVHPGYANGVMVNAARAAGHLVSSLPRAEAPETTQGREGFFHPQAIRGDVESAMVHILLRDFDEDGLNERRRRLRQLAEEAAGTWGASVTVDIVDRYRNMKTYIEAVDPRAITVAVDAAESLGIDLAFEAVRGGTDGARLSEMGLPCPNVFTGGHDFHSRFEWNTVQNLEHALRYVHALVRQWGTESREP